MTFKTLSVLVPTRGRPDRLRTLLQSFAETNDGPADLIFRVDDDDPDTRRLLADQAVVVGPRLDGYRSLPQFFNELAWTATGDLLMCGNDDMVFRTPGWPSRLLEVANCYPDGLFDLGVSTHNADHYPFATVSRRLVDRLGFLADPRIFWVDLFLRDVVRSVGRCVMVHDVRIDHDWAGDEASQNTIYQRDPDYWAGTHARAVADAVARLQGVAA